MGPKHLKAAQPTKIQCLGTATIPVVTIDSAGVELEAAGVDKAAVVDEAAGVDESGGVVTAEVPPPAAVALVVLTVGEDS